jgi:hypothetical protein
MQMSGCRVLTIGNPEKARRELSPIDLCTRCGEEPAHVMYPQHTALPLRDKLPQLEK